MASSAAAQRIKQALLADARRRGLSEDRIAALEAEWPAFEAMLRQAALHRRMTDAEWAATTKELLKDPRTSQLVQDILWPASSN
jgi:hypothetical protein